jgi:hypothetical protein
MTCFTCAESIEILGLQLDGGGWFFSMLILALVLQVGANFVWTKNAQVTREIMQLEKDKREKLIGPSILWTALSTIIYIARVVLIGGNNLWIFIVVLIGNVVGTYWSQQEQEADHHQLSDDILKMLDTLEQKQCSKSKIEEALTKLAVALEKRKPSQMNMKSYRDNVDPKPIEF